MEYKGVHARWCDQEMQDDPSSLAVQVAQAAVEGELGEYAPADAPAAKLGKQCAPQPGNMLLSALPTPGRASPRQGPLMPWELVGDAARRPVAAPGSCSYRDRLQARGQQAMHRSMYQGHAAEAPWHAAAELRPQQLPWEYHHQQPFQQQQHQHYQLPPQPHQQPWVHEAAMPGGGDQARAVQSPSCVMATSPLSTSPLSTSPLATSPLATSPVATSPAAPAPIAPGGACLTLPLMAPESGCVSTMPVGGAQQSPLAGCGGGMSPQELLATIMPQGCFFNSDEVAEQLRAAAPCEYED